MIRNTSHYKRGFSLIELLIAVSISLVLLGGLIKIVTENQRTNALNTAIAELQEKARFSLEHISSDLKIAGYQGCANRLEVPLSVIASDAPTTNYTQSAILGSIAEANDNWAPQTPAGFDTSTRDAVIGSHALSIQFGGPQIGILIEGQVVSGSTELDSSLPLSVSSTEADPFQIAVGDFAIVSNCVNAELFEVTSLAADSSSKTLGHSSSANVRDSFIQAHGSTTDILAETQVMRFNSNVYYVAHTGLENSSGDAITALYRQSLPSTTNNPPVELIQGVENLRTMFGVRTTQGLAYLSADDAAFNAANVESVRIGILMSSWDRVTDENDTKTYVLAGDSIEPANGANSSTNTYPSDSRFRLAFNTTVMIRN